MGVLGSLVFGLCQKIFVKVLLPLYLQTITGTTLAEMRAGHRQADHDTQDLSLEATSPASRRFMDALNAMVGSSRAAKRARRITAELPDEAIHAILSKLDFKSKITAAQVCKKWDQVLKACDLGPRHWDITYNINALVHYTAHPPTDTVVSSGEQFKSTVGRCVTVLVPAIAAWKVNEQSHALMVVLARLVLIYGPAYLF